MHPFIALVVFCLLAFFPRLIVNGYDDGAHAHTHAGALFSSLVLELIERQTA
jgi:hypothetical protein